MPIPNPCDLDSLKIIDSTCFSLQKYVIRMDESALYGHASAIKSVPEKGEIEWVANNGILHVQNEYNLSLGNYSDTSWTGLEFWAFRREILLIKFNPYKKGEQAIYDQDSYSTDTTKNYAQYRMWFDDFADGSWDIDKTENNYVTVTSINPENNVAEGEFNLHFILREQSTVPGVVLSNNIHFSCGHFKAKIYE